MKKILFASLLISSAVYAEVIAYGPGGPAPVLKELATEFEAKKGKKVPDGAIPCQDYDPITGHQPCWLKCDKNKPKDKYFIEGFNNLENKIDGTYELCGEKVQGNPEKITGHQLIKHGCEVLQNVPRDFEGIKEYLKDKDIEGIVWHRDNGDMVKIKKKDFGFKR